MVKKLKKFFIIMVISFSFMFCIEALDYNNIEFSDNIIINDSEKIIIKLPIDYKNNNSKIQYQLIEASKETIDQYETKSAEIIQNLITSHSECSTKENTSISDFVNNSECLAFLEQANSEIHSYLPDFDDENWIIKDITSFDNDNIIYEIENTIDEYNWMWIKAKDINGSDIYQISAIAPITNNQDNEIIAETNENNNSGINEDIGTQTIEAPNTAINTDMVKLIGSCFLVCGLVVLYMYFNGKDKKD